MAYLRLYKQRFCTTPREYVSSYADGLGVEVFENLEEAERAVTEKGGWVVETMELKLIKSAHSSDKGEDK